MTDVATGREPELARPPAAAPGASSSLPTAAIVSLPTKVVPSRSQPSPSRLNHGRRSDPRGVSWCVRCRRTECPVTSSEVRS